MIQFDRLPLDKRNQSFPKWDFFFIDIFKRFSVFLKEVYYAAQYFVLLQKNRYFQI